MQVQWDLSATNAIIANIGNNHLGEGWNE